VELHRLGISDIRKLLDKREVSAREAVDSVFRRIDNVEDRVKAFLTLTRERAPRWGEGFSKG
jgi:aspartyl-tRNA(Asn)/glutamyl-tRNA(Gln) amidotransferase subunit A